MKMKVILQQDVKKVGKKGEIVRFLKDMGEISFYLRSLL